MGKRKDLTGLTFGNLKVLEEIPVKNRQGKILYKCECSCGNIVEVKAINLKKGITKSCGCIKESKIKNTDIIGKKFGSFLVESFDYIDKRNVRKYKCRCDCGNVVSVNVYNLLAGRSTNCGCVRKKSLSIKKKDDMIGKKFGKLTVIEKHEVNKNKKIVYKCLCECGGVCYATTQSLKSGHTSSCGCIKSSGNMLLEQAIKKLSIPYKKEYQVNLDYSDIKYIRFDIYLPTINTAIEFDGEQHYKPIKFFGGEERFKLQKFQDEIKNNYCKENNIKLIRIPYYEKDNILKILQDNLSPTTTE